MNKYSAFSLFKNALTNNKNWQVSWRDATPKSKYDAIIVTVSHKQFKAYTSNDYSRLSSDVKVIIDIKNIVENPTWKL